MRKAYYINLLMLILSTVLFMLLIRNVNGLDARILLSIFLINSLYINLKMSILLKYSFDRKLTPHEKISNFLNILGQVLFVLRIISEGYFKDGLASSTSYVLLIFIAYSWMILESSYIKNNSIINIRKGIILFNEISEFELEKVFLGGVYLNISVNSGERFRIYFSEEEYEYLKNNL